MKLKKIREDSDLLEIEVEGTDVGFVNMIKEELWRDKHVSEAAYIKEHPYMSEPKIYVKMKGRHDTRVAIRRATTRILRRLKGLKQEFENALKD